MARDRNSRDPKAVAVGARIAAARDRKGYAQEEFAIMLGVTKGAIGQWEIGATMPRPARFRQIAELLDVSERWLLSGDEPEEKIRAQTKAEAETLAIMSGIPVEAQPAALAILRAYAANLSKK